MVPTAITVAVFVGVFVIVGVLVAVGVHVGGNVGIGRNCVSWLLLSLLSMTWLFTSAVPVAEPEILTRSTA